MPTGAPIVLTADRTLMAGYRLLFDGMLAASQTTTTPLCLMADLLMPRSPSPDGRARVAPLGLRRVEAALLRDGWQPEEVMLVDDAHLPMAIGPATRVVAITSGEPLGQGMNTSTMTAVVGGTIYPQALWLHLLRTVRRLVAARAPGAKVVLGGPGAWQLAGDDDTRKAMSIDHVVVGYAEGNIAAVIRALASGEALPAVIAGEGVATADIPAIHGASTMGVVEISRGCGLGCAFCTIAGTPMSHLPEETILADVRTNVAAGMTSIAALSEDFFRYGGDGMQVNPPALFSLLRRLRQVEGLRLIQIDHANISSIARYSDDDLATARALLVGPHRHEFPWLNVGVETVSGLLLRANGGAGKMGGQPASEWGDLCATQIRRLCRAGFFPMISLILGLPGEHEDDVRDTLAWIEELRHERVSAFPMLHAPLDGTPGWGVHNLTPLHWRLIRTCYALNFRWIPRMYWDNQTGAGVPLAKRCLLQAMGWGQVLQWQALFAWHAARAR